MEKLLGVIRQTFYFYLVYISLTSDDYFKIFTVLILVPLSFYFTHCLFESNYLSSSTRKNENQKENQIKKVPNSVIYKHISTQCEAVRISTRREKSIEHNHVFRLSPSEFEYNSENDTFTSKLAPYFRCERMNEEFKVQEVGVMKMIIIENHFRPDLSYKTCQHRTNRVNEDQLSVIGLKGIL